MANLENLHVTVVSPEKVLFSGEVELITLPGAQGAFTLLKNHAPMVSSLGSGVVRYLTLQGEEHTLTVNGGFMEVSENQASVCVEMQGL